MWKSDKDVIAIGDESFPPTISLWKSLWLLSLRQGLRRLLPEARKAANQVVRELVADYLDHHKWFKREVQKGMDSLDSGKSVSHEAASRISQGSGRNLRK